MESADTVLLIARLACVGAAAFTASILWSRTRDPAWLLVVLGVVAGYAETVIDVTIALGFLPPDWGTVAGIPLGEAISENLPYALFASGFAVMLARSRAPKA